MRLLSTVIFLCLLTLVAGTPFADNGLAVKGARYFSYTAFTRIVFEIEAAAPYVLTKSADGRSLVLTAYEGQLVLKSALPAIRDGVVSGTQVKEEGGKAFIVIHLDAAAGEVKDFVLRSPDRIVVDIAKGAPAVSAPAPSAAKPVIVLDAGHGGRDSGVVTAKAPEKALTLEYALAVKKFLLKKNPNLTVVLTREKDHALTLQERAAVSNAAGAALFVSIHGAPWADARVYVLDPDEGAVMRAPAAPSDFLGFEAESEQQELLWGRQQAGHAKESGILGRMIARHLGARSGPEPVQAPLAALKAVDAAAVVVELGADMDTVKAAEAVMKGIEQYVRENR